MKSKVVKLFWLLALLCSGFGTTAKARNQLELESTYLGDGWFQYRLTSTDCPFFNYFDYGYFSVVFPYLAQYGAVSDNWAIGTDGNPSTLKWNRNQASHQIRPSEQIFIVQSSQRNFRLATNGLTGFSFQGTGWIPNPVFSLNFSGFAQFACLVPCLPGEQDNSPTNTVAGLQLISDVEIERLQTSDGKIYGLDFSWGYDSTVRLEASRDFTTWTPITYIWGDAGVTNSWRTNVDLSVYGNYFRLSLVANTHVANPSPSVNNKLLNVPVKATSSFTFVPIDKITPLSDGVRVDVKTQAGVTYTVSVVDVNGKVLLSRQLPAVSDVTSFTFKRKEIPAAALFQVTRPDLNPNAQ